MKGMVMVERPRASHNFLQNSPRGKYQYSAIINTMKKRNLIGWRNRKRKSETGIFSIRERKSRNRR